PFHQGDSPWVSSAIGWNRTSNSRVSVLPLSAITCCTAASSPPSSCVRRNNSVPGPAARNVMSQKTVMPARSSATGSSARPGQKPPIRLRSRRDAHLQVQLLATVIAAVVEKGGTAVGQNVDELPPQVVTFARIPCGLRDVFDPLNRLRGDPPAPHGPFLVAPGKAPQARRRLLGPNGFRAGGRRGGRGVDDGDPLVLRAAQQLEPADPPRGPVPDLLRGLQD